VKRAAAAAAGVGLHVVRTARVSGSLLCITHGKAAARDQSVHLMNVEQVTGSVHPDYQAHRLRPDYELVYRSVFTADGHIHHRHLLLDRISVVCVVGTRVCCAKTAEPIEMQFLGRLVLFHEFLY